MPQCFRFCVAPLPGPRQSAAQKNAAHDRAAATRKGGRGRIREKVMSSHASASSLRTRIPARAWTDMLHLAVRQVCPAGYPLILEGDALTDFYYIEKGRLLISYASQNGRERSIIGLEAGNLFNVSTALTGFDNPDSQYLCKEETVLWRFPGRLLLSPDFVCKCPELIIEIMLSLARKNLQMHETLSYTGPDAALIQIARWMLRAAESRASESFRPGVTQQELADRLGIHRATLVRCIHTLKERGIISRFTRNALVVTDMNALRDLAEQ